MCGGDVAEIVCWQVMKDVAVSSVESTVGQVNRATRGTILKLE